MLARLFPTSADNRYAGHIAGPVLLVLLLVMKAAISLGSMFNGRGAAGSADGIPLESYTPASVQTILSLFALLGLANLILCLVGVVVLVRYRALIPLLFALLVTQQLCRYLVLMAIPIARIGAPPGTVINVVLLALMVIGFAVSLWTRERHGN